MALGFHYFADEIDYWNERKKEEKPKPEEKAKPKAEEGPKKSEFDWSKYQDPKNDEFFQEGNHKPPEAFIELMRHPTDKNIKNWFELIEAKNKLMAQLQERMEDYLQGHPAGLDQEARSQLIAKTASLAVPNPAPKLDIRRFRFRLYFDSSCAHCKNMMVTAKDLQNLGFYIELRQLDRERPAYPVPFAIVYASKEEVAEKKITSWPVLFVGDLAKQQVYRINGYFSAKEVLTSLAGK